MTPLVWYPAPYEAHGSTSGEGATRLLGRPRLDDLTVLVRETVQNSWDARAGCQIEYQIHLRQLNSEEMTLLRDVVFKQGADSVLTGPGDAGPKAGLADALATDAMMALEIGDRGTTGLSGPVRADLSPRSNEPTDFIDFVFNLGAQRDKHLGGGTYGFGKAITYVVSRARALVIATRTQTDDGDEYRFIGSAAGHDWAEAGRRFTGRHWWGRKVGGRIEPVCGAEAAEMITALGIQRFAGNGTSLLVLNPDLGLSEDGAPRTPEDAVRHMISSFLWYLWPKLVGDEDSQAAIDASFLLQGKPVPFSGPLEDPQFVPFVEALRAVRRLERGQPIESRQMVPPSVENITYGKGGHVTLGTVGLVKVPTIAVDVGQHRPHAGARPISNPTHHIALMRQAELVVDYIEGPASPYAGFEWAGVFRCHADVDDEFANAEPPTHDSWEWTSVSEERPRSHVRTALRKIDTIAKDFATPREVPVEPGMGPSVARLADRLRAIIPGVVASAPHLAGRGDGGGGGSPRNRARVVLRHATPSYDGAHIQTFEGTIESKIRARIALEVSVTAAVDTGAEASCPKGAAVPFVRAVTVGGCEVEAEPDGRWHAEIPEGLTELEVVTAVDDEVAVRVGVAVVTTPVEAGEV